MRGNLLRVFEVFSMVAVALVAAWTIGCSSDTAPTPTPDQQLQADITTNVDPEVKPTIESLGPAADGKDRPLAAMADDDGGVTNFVENELVIGYQDEAELDRFVERYGGEVLLRLESSDQVQLEGVAGFALVRVDTESLADEDPGPALVELAAERQMFGRAQLGFSSKAARRLTAAAARESAKGSMVALNFVWEPAAIPDSTEEAPNDSGGYEDAYGWDGWNRQGALGYGVPEAWSLLHRAGRLGGNGLKIAVLEHGGVATSPDLPSYTTHSVYGGSILDTPNGSKCSGGSSCPWHGTEVTSVAMAVPDNQFGWVGTGGPVASAVLVRTPLDVFSSSSAMIIARNNGARIINASFGGNVHWAVKAFLEWYELVTLGIRASNALIFASAGNEGRNVDSKTCFLGICWESRFFYPCESAGVICVGGLDDNGYRHDDSNYGSNSVDLDAPFCMRTGPVPGDDGNVPNEVPSDCGTSFSSPFVAGIAALVWAANPSLEAGQVAGVLSNTSRHDHDMHRVDAYRAVASALGPMLLMDLPDTLQDTTFSAGVPVRLISELSIISAPGAEPIHIELVWNSSVQGELGRQQLTMNYHLGSGYEPVRSEVTVNFEPGRHELTAMAIAKVPTLFGTNITLYASQSVTVDVDNPAPEVEITNPGNGSEFCQGQQVVFRARATDANEELPGDAYTWTALQSRDPFPLIVDLGDGPVVSSSNLSAGNWSVGVLVTDQFGEKSTAAIGIKILPRNDPHCRDLPPTALILEPEDGRQWVTTGSDVTGPYREFELKGKVNDPEDDVSQLRIEWFSSTDGKLGEGRDITARIHMLEPRSQEVVVTLRVTDTTGNISEDKVTLGLYVIQ